MGCAYRRAPLRNGPRMRMLRPEGSGLRRTPAMLASMAPLRVAMHSLLDYLMAKISLDRFILMLSIVAASGALPLRVRGSR